MLSHQELKLIRSLHQKKYRDEHNLYLAEGIKLVKEALINQPDNIERILFSSKYSEYISDVPVATGIRTTEISQAELERISSLKTPQGILAIMKIPESKMLNRNELGDLTILLDQVSDPGNLGTILRLADWFGIANVICSTGSVEAYNPKVVQASMGAIFRTNVIYTSLEDFIKEYGNDEKTTVYGTTLKGENLFKTTLHTPAFILLGNETADYRQIYAKWLILISAFPITAMQPRRPNH
jgi:TrmH family RNA methyltransferase